MARAAFIWRRTRGVAGLSPALYPDGYDEGRTETREDIAARHPLTAEEGRLPLDELARLYPAPAMNGSAPQ